MGKRLLIIMLISCCMSLIAQSVFAQKTLIVNSSIDECSRTKLAFSLSGMSPPEKVELRLKSNDRNGKPVITEILNLQDSAYYWSGIIPFGKYVAELYLLGKKGTFLGRYFFPTENLTRKFITSNYSEIIQLRQNDEPSNIIQDKQIIQLNGINIIPSATLMQIVIVTKKGGVVAQYLGQPVNSWSSEEKVLSGEYVKIILQFGVNHCLLK